MAIEQWGFFSVQHILWYGVIRGDPNTRITDICCRAFASVAVSTYLCDLDLFRLGFKHPTFRLRGERPHQLRNRGDHYYGICFKYICFKSSIL